MSAGMNVIFRGNGKRKQEEAAPAEEVFSSQATCCAKRDRYRGEGEREGGREGGREATAAAARLRE